MDCGWNRPVGPELLAPVILGGWIGISALRVGNPYLLGPLDYHPWSNGQQHLRNVRGGELTCVVFFNVQIKCGWRCVMIIGIIHKNKQTKPTTQQTPEVELIPIQAMVLLLLLNELTVSCQRLLNHFGTQLLQRLSRSWRSHFYVQ